MGMFNVPYRKSVWVEASAWFTSISAENPSPGAPHPIGTLSFLQNHRSVSQKADAFIPFWPSRTALVPHLTHCVHEIKDCRLGTYYSLGAVHSGNVEKELGESSG